MGEVTVIVDHHSVNLGRRLNVCLRVSPALLDALDLAVERWNVSSLGEPISRSAFVRRLLAEHLNLAPADLHSVVTGNAKENLHD